MYVLHSDTISLDFGRLGGGGGVMKNAEGKMIRGRSRPPGWGAVAHQTPELRAQQDTSISPGSYSNTWVLLESYLFAFLTMEFVTLK